MSQFTRTRVTRDFDTGEIKGWEEFYEFVRMTDPSLEKDDISL